MAEQSNELLMKIHQSRPTGSTPFPKANGTSFHHHRENHGRGRGHGCSKKNYKNQSDRIQNYSKKTYSIKKNNK